MMQQQASQRVTSCTLEFSDVVLKSARSHTHNNLATPRVSWFVQNHVVLKTRVTLRQSLGYLF
jgi:hypothetical protein